MTDDSDTGQSPDASDEGGAERDQHSETDVPEDSDEWEWDDGDAEAEAAADADDTDDASPTDEAAGDEDDTAGSEGAIVDSATDSADDGDPAATAEEIKRVSELEEQVEAQAEKIEAQAEQIKSQDEQIEAYKRELAKAKKEIDRLREQKEEVADRVRKQTEDDVVEDFFEVRDNLVRALDQGEDANIRGGVEATLMQFDDLLQSLGIEVIDPPAGTEVDPEHHEVVDRVASDHEEGLIEEVYRHGYARSDRVVRAAQVAVSDGDAADDDEESEE